MPRISKRKEFYVIAHNMRSLLNVGSVFRTADAFGIAKIYLTGYTGTPANPVHKNKIAKSAIGAENWVAWEHKASVTRLIKELKSQNIKILGLENNVKAENINKFRPMFPLALLLGEEGPGINKKLLKLCDNVVEIPMLGKKESLNVSVAFGIAAYQLTK
ncbi:MAG: TrmH family RNA methyltransferase [Patescibacteria group bacterium]